MNVSKNSQRGGTKFIPYNIETKEKEERKEREGKGRKTKDKRRKERKNHRRIMWADGGGDGEMMML